jgi:SAM-dependent methyltransferase
MTTTASKKPPATSHAFYQMWYAHQTPVAYTNNLVWKGYVHQLQQLIGRLRCEQNTEPVALEVGSGGGQLQHLTTRYVGLDLAASAARFIQKPFVAASALKLPFRDASFDLVWSIWTLEHISNPQQMLCEMLRVLRPGGYLYLCAAWCVPDWTMRRDTAARQRLRGVPGQILAVVRAPRRWLGWPGIWLTRLWWLGRNKMPNLRYRFLLPDYSATHIPDADACIQIDAAAVILWLRARGALCLSHPTRAHILAARHNEPLIFRVYEYNA